MKVLLDTCIFVDAVTDRKPFSKDAQALLFACAEDLYDGFVSANAVSDIHYIVQRTLHDEQRTRTSLQNILQSVKILDTTSLECLLAFSSKIADYEDAVMVETAKSNDLDAIVTRNLKDFQQSPVQIYTPEQLLKKLGVTNWG